MSFERESSPVDTGARLRHADDADGEGFSRAQIRHLLHAPLRRPLYVVVPWAAILLLSILALFTLPKRYRSSTLILVESEKVPDSFVPRVATEERTRRLEGMRPEILSRTRLERVVEETQPYPDISSMTQAVELVRRRAAIHVSGNDGFAIEFVHSDPLKAQEVANRIATLFIEETIKSRGEQVAGAVDFLVTQVADARTELERKDEAFRRYKEQRMGTLPEQLTANLATLQMYQQESRMVEESLIFAREKRDAMARGAGRPVGGPVSSGGAQGTGDVDDLRRELVSLRSRYTDEHPDVQSLRSRIARLEARLSSIATAEGEGSSDPSTQVALEQLQAATREVEKLESRREALDRQIAVIRERVEQTPRTEQDLANLKRDYDKLNENYSALLSKQLEAQMAGRLEQRWKGDKFRMLDPASLPDKPYFPKAPIVLGLGALAGLFVGLGAALAAEIFDPSIKDGEDLESFVHYPVLARIPHLPALGGSGAP